MILVHQKLFIGPHKWYLSHLTWGADEPTYSGWLVASENKRLHTGYIWQPCCCSTGELAVPQTGTRGSQQGPLRNCTHQPRKITHTSSHQKVSEAPPRISREAHLCESFPVQNQAIKIGKGRCFHVCRCQHKIIKHEEKGKYGPNKIIFSIKNINWNYKI